MSKRFSERMGIVSPSTVIQTKEMSDDLRNSLWNTVYSCCENVKYTEKYHSWDVWHPLAKDIALYFRKTPVDLVDFPGTPWIKEYFYSIKWYSVYDLIEFILDRFPSKCRRNIEKDYNVTLERELSGYRFVSGKLVPISNSLEIEAISESIQITARTGLLGANEHFETALSLFGKRPEPDYRNAIKEAISAVESVAKQLSGSDSQGLDGALTILGKKIDMHGALKQGFSKLYGYSSDEDGIRHAILDEPNVGFDEAKYMIVSCSAFVNYLISKANSCGLLPKEA
ncbi:AbiJ-NTD4 domain-containing protein [Candidatus Electronema sp. TJ]|uniref:AbiJ-NTD4 domain-containing protein n=1 Tax=Candidatus Electronema sp. TJ TaxID=3401573 RepID=UPI003AA84879